jgi:DNA-binding MarR family transcriptional regulator
MDSDAVARLGHLALGTRLKRLGEQLQAGVAEVVATSGILIQPAQMPLLVAIYEGGGALTVAQLVEAIGTSQPAVSRNLGTLERAGFVTFHQDSTDGRVRRAALSKKGLTLLDRLRTDLFPPVAAAAEQLCDGLDLLAALTTIEQRLRDRPFSRRVEEANL